MSAGERELCLDCLRPHAACWCALVPRLETRTRVLILQHPRETRVPVGTARMAHRALVGSTLRVGVDFSTDPVVMEALRGPAVLLFPGADAIDLDELAPTEPFTLVVVDGTWANARKLVRKNPALAALPQVRFTPSRPSEYRIRREPAAHTVATIEAMAHVLGRLEGDPARFEALLVPFRAMVAEQLRFRDEVGAHRDRSRRRWKPLVPPLIAEAADRLVCVHAEPNAVPGRRPGEVIHWLATRLSTGERFEAVLASRTGIAPTTAANLDLPRAAIDHGESLASFTARWRAFARDDDLLALWRTTAIDALAGEGAPAALATEDAPHVDLRPLASVLIRHGRTGTILECATRLGLTAAPPWAQGRGGRRIVALEVIARRLVEEARRLPPTR